MQQTKGNQAADVALSGTPAEQIDQIAKGLMSADEVNAASLALAIKMVLIERVPGSGALSTFGLPARAQTAEEVSNHRSRSNPTR